MAMFLCCCVCDFVPLDSSSPLKRLGDGETLFSLKPSIDIFLNLIPLLVVRFHFLLPFFISLENFLGEKLFFVFKLNKRKTFLRENLFLYFVNLSSIIEAN